MSDSNSINPISKGWEMVKADYANHPKEFIGSAIGVILLLGALIGSYCSLQNYAVIGLYCAGGASLLTCLILAVTKQSATEVKEIQLESNPGDDQQLVYDDSIELTENDFEQEAREITDEEINNYRKQPVETVDAPLGDKG